MHMRLMTIFIAMMIFLPLESIYAEEENETDTMMELCAGIQSLAETIMATRQKGTSISTIMKIVKNIATNKKQEEILVEMVIDAYDKPQYSGEEYRKKTTNEFANKWALECYKEI